MLIERRNRQVRKLKRDANSAERGDKGRRALNRNRHRESLRRREGRRPRRRSIRRHSAARAALSAAGYFPLCLFFYDLIQFTCRLQYDPKSDYILVAEGRSERRRRRGSSCKLGDDFCNARFVRVHYRVFTRVNMSYV
jgi:hypothetical protein